ncbi:PRTRC system protein C [Muricauda sp. 334s03]|uniref:PRTRC system protein C n=1 Tax=Flagellimonas yonaguniensis TaxID=3031325 RepID=A0ABT5XZC2_9FLAO|nr:PRTRC system protein C [[Muricauda] yonaguniensis]MDF0716543.1 PRTRC system protein C [[Muricauda] yonaguniensis]
MEIATIERKYIYQNGNNNSIVLDDLDSLLTHQQVMEHYSQIYAELTNANIMDKGIVNGYHEIHFKTLAGTKG